LGKGFVGSTGKVDAMHWKRRIIKELKPDNCRARRRGLRQLEKYRKEVEKLTGEKGKWKITLETY